MAEPKAKSSTPTPPSRFYPVDVDAIDHDVLQLDLYMWHERSPRPVLYRAQGVEFSERDRRELLSNGVETLFIPDQQHAVYREMLARRIDDCFEEPDCAPQERAAAALHVCRRAVEDVLMLPDRAESVAAVSAVSKALSKWSQQNPKVFSYLLDLGAHDFYTLTHMINVGVGCAMLAHQLRPKDAEFISDCLQGGLLHDLGKRGIPEDILCKEGRLDPGEWEMVRKHPALGYAELSKAESVPPRVLEIVRDHHERLDAEGYPRGISGDSIGLHTRICTVVDCFDAVVSKRPYRDPIHPSGAIKLLTDVAGTIVDHEVLLAWAKLVNTLLAEDPQRTKGLKPGESIGPSVTNLLPRPMVQEFTQPPAAQVSTIGADNRRRFPRKRCQATIRATFLRQGKAAPVLPGESVDLRMLDIAKGGVLLQSDWPFTLGDVLVLMFPQGDAPPIRLHARVVRVRKDSGEDGKWVSGVRFIAESELRASSGAGSRKAS